MAVINNIGVITEIVASSALILLLAFHIKRGPGVVLQTAGAGTGHELGYFGAFLGAALMSAYVFYGFDTAGSLAEETNNPRNTRRGRSSARSPPFSSSAPCSCSSA